MTSWKSLRTISTVVAFVCGAVAWAPAVAGQPAPMASGGVGTASSSGPSLWKVVKSPNPLTANGTLEADSCVTADVCEAVGSFTNDVGVVAKFAEGWNGTSWRRQATPDPTGATTSELDGVSCVAADACEAVGSYDHGGREVSLAEGWNGTGWKQQASPDPVGASGVVLSGVSCAAADVCEAVGSYTNSSGVGVTLAEVWNGTAWKIQPTPDLANSGLSEVSCPAVDACEAVGGSYTASSGLAEGWNGAVWSVQPTPDLPDAHGNLLGVSCAAAKACEAVGASSERGDMIPDLLAEGWNGAEWSVQDFPEAEPASDNELPSVSCGAADACEAVGTSYPIDAPGGPVPFVDGWNGAKWSVQPTPAEPSAAGTSLGGVSCVAADACEAVGSSYIQPEPGNGGGGSVALVLAEGWNGAGWTVQDSPGPTGVTGVSLAGVSCPAADACEAVGDSEVDGLFSYGAFAEGWNGTGWSVQAVPDPPGALDVVLHGVSCATADACEAVGDYFTSSGDFVTLAERWNGTAWSIQPTPTSPGSIGGELGGVSCTAADACEAVGVGSGTLAEVWNGTVWSVQVTPKASAAPYPYLSGVSCSAADFCEAVGGFSHYNGSGHPLGPLAEVWNGTAWSVQATPVPVGGTQSELGAVSCTAVDACEAVGSYTDSGIEVTLADVWNGTAWSVQATPTPAGATDNHLAGVSCAAADACEAVGSYTNSGEDVMVALVWNGTAWKAQAPPKPHGATQSELDGVSCTASDACAAVGSYQRSGTELTLILRS